MSYDTAFEQVLMLLQAGTDGSQARTMHKDNKKEAKKLKVKLIG